MRKLLKKISMLAIASALCIGTVLPVAASEVSDQVEVSYSKKVYIAEEANVPGAKVINALGFAGMQITVGDEDIEVTAIGRWYTIGSALCTRNFMIHDTEGNVVLDYGVATCTTTGFEDEGFVYANIDGGVTLKANTTYYLVSDYWGENDKFYTASVTEHTDVATLDGIVILNPETNEYEFYSAQDIGWGPMDFKYMTDSANVDPDDTDTPDDTETPDEAETPDDTGKEEKVDNDAGVDNGTSSVEPWVIAIAVIVIVAVIVVVVVIVQKKKKK